MDEDSDAIIVAGEGLPRSSSPRQHPNLALLVVVVDGSGGWQPHRRCLCRGCPGGLCHGFQQMTLGEIEILAQLANGNVSVSGIQQVDEPTMRPT